MRDTFNCQTCARAMMRDVIVCKKCWKLATSGARSAFRRVFPLDSGYTLVSGQVQQVDQVQAVRFLVESVTEARKQLTFFERI